MSTKLKPIMPRHHDMDHLRRSPADPLLAKKLLVPTRQLYAAASSIQKAGLPKAVTPLVSEIIALCLIYGNWLRDSEYRNGMGQDR